MARRLLTIFFLKKIPSGNFDLLDDEASQAQVVTATLTKLSGKGGKIANGGTIIWTSAEEDTEDTFSFTVAAMGRYSFCISVQPTGDDDDVSQQETYPIGFNLRLDPLPRSLPQEESGPEAETGMHLIETASYIENDWKNLMDHFSYLRSREATYVQLTNQISDRLIGWNIVEALLVVCMAVGQVIYWKKFFETRRYL
jgi:p24 family protein beta-1